MKPSISLGENSIAQAEKALRDDHHRLEQLTDSLQAAKDLPRLLAAAEELRQALLAHFAHEEHPGGLYDSLAFGLPQHRKDLGQLIQDHRDLTAAAWELCQRARDPKPRLAALRKEAAQLVKKLHRHEKLEHEIAHHQKKLEPKKAPQPPSALLSENSIARAEKALRNDHHRLEQLADSLQAAQDLPQLLAAAEELRQALHSHFAHEEHPGGLYDSLAFGLPQHRKDLGQLIQDHRDLTAAAWELCQRARDPKPRLAALRKDAAQLVKKLHRHEKLEHEIAHQPGGKGPAHRA